MEISISWRGSPTSVEEIQKVDLILQCGQARRLAEADMTSMKEKLEV